MARSRSSPRAWSRSGSPPAARILSRCIEAHRAATDKAADILAQIAERDERDAAPFRRGIGWRVTRIQARPFRDPRLRENARRPHPSVAAILRKHATTKGEWTMKRFAHWALVAAAIPVAAFGADAMTDYYERVAERDVASFRTLDTDHDGSVTRQEIVGDLDFGPRFTDMDVNRDGIVTFEELTRYIRLHYGVEVPAAKP
jgi:hypothetical protein